MWYCMRKPGVAEKYCMLRAVQDMYEGSVTMVKCVEGETDGFKV